MSWPSRPSLSGLASLCSSCDYSLVIILYWSSAVSTAFLERFNVLNLYSNSILVWAADWFSGLWASFVSLDVVCRNHSCSIACFACMRFLQFDLNRLSTRSREFCDSWQFQFSSEKSFVFVTIFSISASSFSPLNGSWQVRMRTVNMPTDQRSHR